MENAKKHFAAKAFTRAILDYKNALRETPRNAEVFYQLGLAYAAMGDSLSAAVSLMKATEIEPKHRDAQLKLSYLMAASREPEMLKQAEKRVNEVLREDPENAEALNTLALTELQQGKTDDAAELFSRALNQAARVDSTIMLANLKLAAKDHKAAESILKSTAQRRPQSVEIRIALARYYLIMRNWPEAEVALRHALEVDSKSSTALFDLGMLQLVTNRQGEADQTFGRLSEQPKYRSVHAIFLFQTGKRDAAIAELEHLFKIYPEDRDMRDRLVQAYTLVNRLPDAEKTVDAALKQNPKDTNALEQRSQIHLNAGRPAEAQRDLLAVLRLKPESAKAHYLMAKVHLRQGSVSSYKQELNEALRLDPNFIEARIELSQVYRSTKAPRAALDIMDRVPDSQKHLPAYVAERNWILLAAGDDKGARAGIDLGLSLGKSATLLHQDAIWKLRHKQLATARTSLQEAIALNPEDLPSLRVLAVTYFQEKQVLQSVETVRAHASKYPKSAQVQLFLASWLRATGDSAEARKAYLAAKLLDPSAVAADIAMAKMDSEEGKGESSRKRLEALLPANGRNPEVLLTLGLLEHRANNMRGAMDYYGKVLEVDANNVRALNNL
ncbi:MAG: tetratricopeptide repeat protein, partial [Bryobacteraceae bacterium]